MMESHHLQVAILVQDGKLDCFGIPRNKFGSDKHSLAFYPGQVLPPRADGSMTPHYFVVCKLFDNRTDYNK